MATGKPEEDVFSGAVWEAPSDVRVFNYKGKTLLVIPVELPNGDAGFLTYFVDPKDEDKFDFGKAADRGDITEDQFQNRFGGENVIEGGNALELTGLDTQGMTVGEWFVHEWRSFIGFNPVIKDDMEMAKLYTEALLEGWGENEIQTRVTHTKWWRSASEEQRAYQTLSVPQKREAHQAMAGNLVHSYLEIFGQPIDPTNKYIKNLARQVASGEISYGEALSYMQKRALKDPNTRYATEVREYRRRGVNIENKINELRDVSHEWGVDLNDERLSRWATQINDLARSDEDFAEMAKGLAEAQWGSREAGTSGRSRDTSVDEWAAPYMSSFTQLMEQGNAATTDLLFDRGFRDIFSDYNMTVGDFENAIRSSEAWLSTNNAKRQLNDTMSQVGQILGYA